MAGHSSRQKKNSAVDRAAAAHVSHEDADSVEASSGNVFADLGLAEPETRLAKAELARIGRYYASESMLVWDAQRARYDADGTPSTGHDTLFAHYAALLRGEAVHERGEHAVF